MTHFEFIFSLYSLLLGFSLVELLSGLGRTLKLRLSPVADRESKLQIGWLTPLLGIFVMLDLLSFWSAAWAVRDLLSVSGASLMSIMLFASAYYIAAHLVFPDDLSKSGNLDAHYFVVRRVVYVLLIGLLVVQLAYYASNPLLTERLTNPRALTLTAVLVALLLAAYFAKSKVLNALILIALILRYVLVYAI